MPLRPCLDCGGLSPGPRCPTHQRANEAARTRAKRARRPYTSAERARRADTVAAWRDRNGDVCPGWHTDPHPATVNNPLTADHPTPVGQGGPETAPLTVLCRRCNGRKSDQLDRHST